MDLVGKNLKGLYARGNPDGCPRDRLLAANDIMFRGNDIATRPAYLFPAFTKNSPVVSHLSIYKPLPVAGISTPVVIQQDILGGPSFKIWNSNNVVPIFGSLTMNFHSWINFFGRGYFTLHDTVQASVGDNVQVYQNGITSRDAAGLKPISAMLAALSGAPGNLGVGTYLFDVCYITDSGFITKPSGNVKNVNCFGTASVDLTVIPIGPAGTAKRQIVSTKAIPLGTYTGNPNDYEFFMSAEGLINDNVTVVKNISYFDGNLNDSANPLLDLLETIPCGIGIGEFNNRMLVWGEAANNSVIRVSNIGEPEAFSATSGVIIVDPTESGGVTNCVGFNGQLYITKRGRMFVATDNGGDPSSWDVIPYDAGVGSTTYGISRVVDSTGKHLNEFLIASPQGLFFFDGIVRTPELTYYIEDIWTSIDPAQFSKTEVFINPFQHHIYVKIIVNGGAVNVLVGDFSLGLDSENIKWTVWTYGFIAGVTQGFALETNPDGVSVTGFVTSAGGVLYFNPKNSGGVGVGGSHVAILQTPPIILDETQRYHQINKTRIRQKNGANANISVQPASASQLTKLGTVINFPFVGGGDIEDVEEYTLFVDLYPTIKIFVLGDNDPRISRIMINADIYGEESP